MNYLEVSKPQHFSKAAENLYLTPATVSARNKQLEEQFNTTLFTRERNSIQLTPAGEKLLPYATQLVDTFKQARQVLSEQDLAFISFGATPNAASLIMSELLNAFYTRFRELAVTTETYGSEQLSRQLHERSIDFALTTEPLKSSDIDSVLLHEEQLFLLKKKDAKPNEINNFVQINWSQKATLAIISAIPECKHYQLKTNDPFAALRYFKEHGGSIVLPRNLHNDIDNEHNIESQAIASVALYCAHLKERPHPIVQEIIQFIRQNLSPSATNS